MDPLADARSFRMTALQNAERLARSASDPGRSTVSAGTEIVAYCFQAPAPEPTVTVKEPCTCLEKLIYSYLYSYHYRLKQLHDPNTFRGLTPQQQAAAQENLSRLAGDLQNGLTRVLDVAALSAELAARRAQGRNTADVENRLRRATQRAVAEGVDLECKTLPATWPDYEFSISEIEQLQRALKSALSRAKEQVEAPFEKFEHRLEAALEQKAKEAYRKYLEEFYKPAGQRNQAELQKWWDRAAAFESMRKLLGQANTLNAVAPNNPLSKQIIDYVTSTSSTISIPSGPGGLVGHEMRLAGPLADMGVIRPDYAAAPQMQQSTESALAQSRGQVWSPEFSRHFDAFSQSLDAGVDSTSRAMQEQSGVWSWLRTNWGSLAPSRVLPDVAYLTPVGQGYLLGWTAGKMLLGMGEFLTGFLTDPLRTAEGMASQFVTRYEQVRSTFGEAAALEGALLLFTSDLIGTTAIIEALRMRDSVTGRRLSTGEAVERFTEGSLNAAMLLAGARTGPGGKVKLEISSKCKTPPARPTVTGAPPEAVPGVAPPARPAAPTGAAPHPAAAFPAPSRPTINVPGDNQPVGATVDVGHLRPGNQVPDQAPVTTRAVERTTRSAPAPWKPPVDLVKAYADLVASNRMWTWADDFPQGTKLTAGQKQIIRQAAIDQGLIPNVPYKPGTRFVDFEKTGLIRRVDHLPESLWKASDAEQFAWLDSRIYGGRPPGTTWHHSDVPGRMELVPSGIHRVFPHDGGRSPGNWAAGKR